MDQPPPLSPEEASELAGKEYANLGQPQTVKIFGILHIVFAILGFLSIVYTIFITVFGNPFLKFSATTPASKAQAEAQLAMEEQMLPATIGGSVLVIIIGTLMLIAGVKMLKSRRDGLKWSNRYAWTSLAGKAINLILVITYSIPAMKEMTDRVGGSTPMPGFFGPVMAASMIVGVLITCTYPILSLILLNKPATKAWFANQPA